MNEASRLERAKHFVRRLVERFTDAALTRSAAQLAYYTLFALFPFVLMLLSLTSRLPVEGLVETALGRARGVLPADAYAVVEGQVFGVVKESQPRLFSLGFVLAVWGASRAVDALRVALNRVNAVTETRPFWRRQLLALGVTLALTALVVATAAIALLATRVAAGGALSWALRLVLPALSVALVLMVAALCYGWLPDVPRRFRFGSPGALVATAAWLVGTWGLSRYVEHFDRFNVAYGSVGGVMLLLTWLYLSGVVFIFGAQVDAVAQGSPAPAPEAD
ncbi:MAG: YihY/virulence factor BrkB family protein [Myxococcaceae bacterium]|nr:YihY/virulence factor BrkB family protein [Myxococcaceae bacterium]